MTGAASAALNASQFEEGLAKQEGISDAHKQVWVLFWKEKEPDIHRAMVNKSRWNDSLQSHSWRIDVQTRSKAQAQLSKPVAIVEVRGVHDCARGACFCARTAGGPSALPGGFRFEANRN
jgi:hypothetical protein